MEDLKDKVAIVTGAGQGVGRGIALALAKRGVKLALLGRTVSKVEAVRDEIGNGTIALACDVKDGAAVRAGVDAVARHFGGIDILVNNAQEVPLGAILPMEDEAFEAGFASGPLATFRFMKACHPELKRRGGGTIINFTSSAGIRWDMANYGPYGAIKQAIRVLTRAAASEWGPDNIRVLTIAPHANSPGLEGWIQDNPNEAEEFFRSIPLRRIGDCENDIGNAVVALCGKDLSYLTGATIPLDGGQANFD